MDLLRIIGKYKKELEVSDKKKLFVESFKELIKEIEENKDDVKNDYDVVLYRVNKNVQKIIEKKN